jgi:hypothetical protein
VEVVVVLLFVGVALAAAVIGRRWTLALPLIVWPIWFLGLAQDWWGYGMGDGWQYGAALIILVSLASVAVLLVLRSFARSAFGRGREHAAH